MKLSHAQDVRLFDSFAVGLWSAVLLVVLAALPFVLPGYQINYVNNIALYIIIAVGLNLLVGYTGQISLGHAAFMAIGAYSCVAMVTHWGLPFLPALLLSGFVAAAFGWVVGLPALRMEGPYLTIATLGFGIATQQILAKIPFTGGHMGLHTPPIVIGPWTLETDVSRYYLILPITVLVVIGAYNISRSRIGRAFQAVRDSDVAAQATGVDLTFYKTLAFAVSTFFTGIAGALMAHSTGFVSPEEFNVFLSIKLLAIIVVGGLGSILGSVLGPTLMISVEQALTAYGEISAMVFGAIMIVVIIFEPLGLRGRWLKIKRYWKTWPF